MTAVQRKIIRWEDPPPPRNGRAGGGRPPGSPWDGIAEVIRDERGRWAVIFESRSASEAGSVRVKVSQGAALCFTPAGHFQARVRTINGVHTVYVRYVGERRRL